MCEKVEIHLFFTAQTAQYLLHGSISVILASETRLLSMNICHALYLGRRYCGNK